MKRVTKQLIREMKAIKRQGGEIAEIRRNLDLIIAHLGIVDDGPDRTRTDPLPAVLPAAVGPAAKANGHSLVH